MIPHLSSCCTQPGLGLSPGSRCESSPLPARLVRILEDAWVRGAQDGTAESPGRDPQLMSTQEYSMVY